jgi:biopolymer transport protein ExbD
MERTSPNVEIERFLNGKHLLHSQLNTALQAEFSRRPDWVVYLDADPDISWSEVIQAIDMVQAVHGRVILARRAAFP